MLGIDLKKVNNIENTFNFSRHSIVCNNTIKEITFSTNPEGEVFPEEEMDISLKKLNGFNWRILEKITKKEELFLK